MRMRYACLGWNCYPSETTIEIIAAVVGPSLPALTETPLLVHQIVHLLAQNHQQPPTKFLQVKKFKSNGPVET